MSWLNGVLAAFGLSASAGLNAYIPLLVVALTARYTPWLTLNPPWDVLADGRVIAVLVLLAGVEFFADKIPAVNHLNDFVQSAIRPVAGAIVFAASSNAIGQVHPVLALVAGLLVAGGVHAAKSAVIRPAVTVATGGAGNPVVSFLEDVVALVTSLLALLIPALFAAAAILLVAAWLSRPRRPGRPSTV